MGTIVFHAASVSVNITFSSCSQFLLYLPFLNAQPIKKKANLHPFFRSNIYFATGPHGEASGSPSWNSKPSTDTNESFKEWDLSFMTAASTSSDNPYLLIVKLPCNFLRAGSTLLPFRP